MSYQVEFKRSGKTVSWKDQYESILDLAETHGIKIENECQQGFCGTCVVKLLSGEVKMETDDGLDEADREKGMILTCTAVPVTDITLEA